jgi:hypothetical protein
MKSQETLLLKRGDVAALLSLDECIAAAALVFEKAATAGSHFAMNFAE